MSRKTPEQLLELLTKNYLKFAQLDCIKIAHYILKANHCQHYIYEGEVVYYGVVKVAPHYWIAFSDGKIADFSLKKNFEKAPVGVFEPDENIQYIGNKMLTLRIDEYICQRLLDFESI